MLEHAPAPTSAAASRSRLVDVVAVAAVAVAAATVVVRVPAAFDTLDRRASENAHQTPIGREIQASDSLGIQNEFLIQALSLLPRNATYVVEQPPSPEIAATYGIAPATLLALRGYVRFLLLPRREAPPAKAEYVLCYACDTDPYDKRGMKRLWSDPHGLVIGELRR